MLTINKKCVGTSIKIHDWKILGFRNLEKVGGTQNEILPLVIIATIVEFDVS